MTRLEGTWFVLPTPFDQAGALDLEGLRRLVDLAIGWGADGLTALGVTSEAAELSEEERDAVLRVVAGAAAGRVPLVVGCSAPDASSAAARARRASEEGALAAMVAAPPGRGAEEIPALLAHIADEGGLPLVVQDEPAATGVVLPVPALVGCVRAAGAETVKLEDPPTAPKIAALLQAAPGLAVFGGLGGAFALSELRHGAVGTMTGFAYPEILRAVRERLAAGDPGAAARVFDRFLPLIQFEAQPGAGLAVRKELLRRRGAFSTAVTRRGAALDDVTRTELGEVLARVGLDPGPEPLSL